MANRTILRIVFELAGAAALDIECFGRDFSTVASRFDMHWQIHGAARRPRVLVAVSKQGHCLKSLLHRWEVGTLRADIVGVISNHDALRRLVEWHGLPFHYLPIESGQKVEQEQKLLDLFVDQEADLLVLARYMQILTDKGLPATRRASDQYPSLILARLQRREALSSSVCPWSEADRCDRALRQ